MTSKLFLLILFVFAFKGIAQSSTDHCSFESSVDTLSVIVKTSFTLNEIPVNAEFDYDKYIEVFGRPDREWRGGPAIIEEFGCDDFRLYFSQNRIWAGHCYLSDAFVKEKGININGIEIGDHRKKVESTFNIDTRNKKEIWIWGNALLIIYFNANDHICAMHFSQKIT
ncbi:hypothetical protein AB8P51_15100 [Muriicola sp. SD30]|uniref:hypothetical protein n=1 Tax=Muriicola sp. SD30 TaxID=3240936 RepID=UPI003510B4ED